MSFKLENNLPKQNIFKNFLFQIVSYRIRTVIKKYIKGGMDHSGGRAAEWEQQQVLQVYFILDK